MVALIPKKTDLPEGKVLTEVNRWACHNFGDSFQIFLTAAGIDPEVDPMAIHEAFVGKDSVTHRLPTAHPLLLEIGKTTDTGDWVVAFLREDLTIGFLTYTFHGTYKLLLEDDIDTKVRLTGIWKMMHQTAVGGMATRMICSAAMYHYLLLGGVRIFKCSEYILLEGFKDACDAMADIFDPHSTQRVENGPNSTCEELSEKGALDNVSRPDTESNTAREDSEDDKAKQLALANRYMWIPPPKKFRNNKRWKT